MHVLEINIICGMEEVIFYRTFVNLQALCFNFFLTIILLGSNSDLMFIGIFFLTAG